MTDTPNPRCAPIRHAETDPAAQHPSGDKPCLWYYFARSLFREGQPRRFRRAGPCGTEPMPRYGSRP
ncbi:hypothetical protein [Azospirillum endophyticum]